MILFKIPEIITKNKKIDYSRYCIYITSIHTFPLMAERRGIKRKNCGDDGGYDDDDYDGCDDDCEMDDMMDNEPINLNPENAAAIENLAYWLDQINKIMNLDLTSKLHVATPGIVGIIESIITSLQFSAMFAPENADEAETEQRNRSLAQCCIQAGMILRDLCT